MRLHAVLDNPIHHPDVLRKTAAGWLKTSGDPHFLVYRALRVYLTLAIETLAARNVVKRHNTIAGLEFGDSAADGGDHACGFVPVNTGRSRRLCSIFFRSVWQMPHASTRIRISPAPIAGVGISSMLTILLPRYTAACMVSGMALTSESAVGNKIPQHTRGTDTTVAQPDQLRQTNQRIA